MIKEIKECGVELRRLNSDLFNLIIKNGEIEKFNLVFDMFDLIVLHRFLCDIFKENKNG